MKLYSVSEVQEILGLSQRQIYRLIKGKEIKAFKIGKEWRIKKEDLEAFIDKKAGN